MKCVIVDDSTQTKRIFKPKIPSKEQQEHKKYRCMIDNFGEKARQERLECRNKYGRVVDTTKRRKRKKVIDKCNVVTLPPSNPIVHCIHQFTKKKMCPTCECEYTCLTVFHDPNAERKCSSCGYGISFRAHKCNCSR